MSPSAPTRANNPMLGVTLKIASVAIFLFMASCLKAAEGIPPGELVFFRSFFALIPILIFLGMRGELHSSLKTQRLGGHIVRGIVGTAAMGFLFLALTKLPLPETTTINYTTPLIIVVLSAIIFKEQVRLYRWSAVLLGVLGVLIVVWPRLTLFSSGATLGSGETIGVIAALVGATLSAIAMLSIRNLVTTEASGTIVLYFSLLSSLLAGLTLPFAWVTPTPGQWLLLISAGIAGGIAQIFLTECYRHAEMSLLAPFEYTSLILSIIVGFVIFSEVPTLNMLFGGFLLVCAGIFVILREQRLGLKRAAAKKVTSPHG